MARKDTVWEVRLGTYIETTSPSGYDVLINGSDHYLNFGTVSGTLGYGFRDNGGTMQFKDSGGSWAAFGSGGGGSITLKTNGTNNGSQTILDLIEGTNITLTDDGLGGVTIDAAGGGGTPGGSTTQLQYNNAGAFGGISGATTDGTAVTYASNALLASNLNIGVTTGSAKVNIDTASIGGIAAQTDDTGILMRAATAAASGAANQQCSPAITFQGNGWNSTASASQPVKFRMSVSPLSSSVPHGYFYIESSMNGAAYTKVLEMLPGGGLRLPNSTQLTWGIAYISSTGSYNTYHARGGNMSAGQYHHTFQTGSDIAAATSGTTGHVRFTTSYAPTSGTGVFNFAEFNFTVNQTGGANGITRGIYLNPTLTAASDFRGFEMTHNSGYALYQSGSAARNYLNGKIGAGVTSPNALIHIAAGTAAARTAPLMFTSGTLMTTPETGAVEFDGTHYYGTIGSRRVALDNIARVVSAASYTTNTGTSLDINACDTFVITAQAGDLLFKNPSGSPVQGDKLIIRIKDNGTARALTYGSQFRASSDLALPTTTIISKTLYMGFIYNSTDTKRDLLAVLDNF